VTRSYRTPCGDLDLVEGIEPWKTVEEPDYSCVGLNLGSPNPFFSFDVPQTMWSVDIKDLFPIPRAGLEESRLGMQTWFWSYLTLLESNVIQEDGSVIGRTKIRAHAVGEPGNKTRIVTMAEAAFSVYMQPFARRGKEVLEIDHAVRSGLVRGWSGYSLVCDLRTLNYVIPEDYVFMAGDYLEATDHMFHKNNKLVMTEVFKSAGLANSYTLSAINLLCSPREYLSDGVFKTTTKGILMGDPGTKVA
jgi:hypothetical protein